MASNDYKRRGPQRFRTKNYSDPDAPDHRPAWWEPSVCHWWETMDWTGDLTDPWFKNKYLCVVPGELAEDRTARVDAESPEPFFKDAVKDHASIFTQFELADDAPESLIELQDNVDQTGNDLWSWSTQPLEALFRDGGALLGCDAPPSGQGIDRAEMRPRLLWVPMRDVFGVEYRNYGGVSTFSRVSIRRQLTRRDSKNMLQSYSQYWIYELDENRRCTVTVKEDSPDQAMTGGKFQVVTDSNGESMEARPLLGADGQQLTRLPFTDKFSWIGNLHLTEEQQLYSPFADILALNKEHYNQKSEYGTVRRKTAVPKIIIYHANGVPPKPDPFYSGSGRVGHFAAGSQVTFLELQGQSLPILRQAALDTQEKIAQRDNKLFHTGGARSATEAEIESQKAKVGMPRVKRLIESAYQDLFTIWELFANPSPEPVGSIVISDAAMQSPPNPAKLTALLQALAAGAMTPLQFQAQAIQDGLLSPEAMESGMQAQAAVQGLPTDPNEEIQ